MANRPPQRAVIYTPDGNSVTVDAAISYHHKVTVDTTDFPVEVGADITDHKRRRPDQVTIEGLVSNTPVADARQLSIEDYDQDDPQNAKTAHQYLDGLTTGSQLCTVVTPLQTYSDMALVDLDMPKTVADGDVFKFTATFKKIFTVTNATVTILTRSPSGQALKNNGKQPTTAATQSQVGGSALFRAKHSEAGQAAINKAKAAVDALKSVVGF